MIRRLITATCCLTLVFASVHSPAGAQSILGNGGFETPDDQAGVTQYSANQMLGAWKVGSGPIDHVRSDSGFGLAADGNFWIDLNADRWGSVLQFIPTTAGTTYTLTFQLAGNPGAAPAIKTMDVFWEGNNVAVYNFDTTGRSPSDMGWRTETLQLTAADNSSKLEFSSTTPSSIAGPALDDVSLTAQGGGERSGCTPVVQWDASSGGNDHYYQAVCDALTWEEAKAAAEAAGGYLATTTSAEENSFLYNLIQAESFWTVNTFNAAIGPWLGAAQAQPCNAEGAGCWEWVTGETWSYTNWQPGEPSNSGNTEHYLHFYGCCSGLASRSSIWNDISNDVDGAVLAYLIEWESDPERPPECGDPGAICGGGEDEELQGTPEDEFIYGGGGDDTIDGGGGNDVIVGGNGNDTLVGGSGEDVIQGGAGDDVLIGDATRGSPFITGGGTFRAVQSEGSADTLIGGDGNDSLSGGGGGDQLDGGTGVDSIMGGSGNDSVTAGDQKDNVNGGGGDDRIKGDGGNDNLKGAAGNDVLNGGAAPTANTMNGGPGRDICIKASKKDNTKACEKTPVRPPQVRGRPL